MATSDTITGVKAKAYSVTGPASYATGGFLHNASADFSWIGFVDVIVTTRGVLPPVDFEPLLNKNLSSAEALGQVTIKIVRGRYDKASLGTPTGNPAGTTVRAVKFAAATTVGSSHTHTLDHTHGSFTSANESPSGLGLNLAALSGTNMRNHHHDFTIAALAVTSGAGTHTHDRSFEYDHTHTRTLATTDISAVELANLTNISGTTFTIIVYGFGKT